MIVCFPRTSLDSPFHRFLNKRIDNRVANHYQIQNTDLVHPDQPAEPILFSGLPPLHPGQPVLHVHNGIQNARQLASAGEPDAESVFRSRFGRRVQAAQKMDFMSAGNPALLWFVPS